MNEYEAMRAVGMTRGRIKVLNGIFEMLDTKVTMDYDVGSPEFKDGYKQLGEIQSEIDANEEKLNFLQSFA